MSLTLEIPDTVASALRLPNVDRRQQLLETLAIGLYSRRLLSFGKARELTGLNQHEFNRLLNRNKEAAQPGTVETTKSPGIDDQIEHLYDEIISLTREEPLPGQSRDEELDRAYTKLIELQTAEAKSFREQFESSLNMPIDAGQTILKRARALRKELEDLAASDPAPPETHEA